MRDESWPIARSERAFVPLTEYLETVDDEEDLVLTFDEITRIISRDLPTQARTDDAWWGSDPRHPYAVAWLRVDRRAYVDLDAETVTFTHEVFERNNGIDATRAMRVSWANYARSSLSREEPLSGNHPHVLNGYWEPHDVYVLRLACEGMYKVGISRIDANRIVELSERGVTLVDRIQLANQWAAKILEFTVLELAWEAWVRPHRFSTGRKGETERWLDWLVPPALEDLLEALEERNLPCWNATTYRDSGAKLDEGSDPDDARGE
ncbi:hypothetical protein G3N18_09835 [Microbacterium sp. 2C]|uniref:DUF7662 domain-containing protein n=1 Tax=Microbacterium paulum TaxID=2707006 RepID=UPI0018C2FC04|nr:hypothetical protein [Microbacterium paulum]MBG0718360.1 hypothetical protein [Microbacterium paulum]